MRIVIVGGGVIGSAIAYFLKADPLFTGEVVVIERDPSYRRASSALSASSIRQQFSTPLNIAMSRFGWDFLSNIGQRLATGGEAPDIGLQERGYLYLAGRETAGALRKVHAVQSDEGAEVELLHPLELEERFAWMQSGDLALASLGTACEGWFDGYGVLQAFRKKAQELGVLYRTGEAAGFDTVGGRLTQVRLRAGDAVACDVAVNAAGPWAGEIAAMVDIGLPVRPQRRCVFVFRSPESARDCPLVIDPSGLWFRPEGAGFIAGVPPPSDAEELPLEVDYTLWDNIVWPALAHRVPGFEAARVTGAWAGYYEFNTFDGNAILGLHPDCENLYFANGFSGHGMQHAPAAGRGLAEAIVHGGYRSLDLSPLGFERLLRGEPYPETCIIG
jgi:FAD-dependent oxidoreductase domain-containing protein 1